MANKSKVLVNFARMKDDELMVAATTIISAMTDNVHFETPSPSLESVQVLVDDYAAKLNAARRRGAPSDTALKNEVRQPLEEALQKLGYYVNATAQGHLSTLLSSGFRSSSGISSLEVPLKIEAVKVRDGRQSGQVRLDFAPQRAARMYECVYRKQHEEAWSAHISTTSSRLNIIAPLSVGQYYEIRVRGINTHGQGDWSDIVTIMVR
ncbi:fibronectin type III domain-containing protein [Sphingobacterium bambusae]|uniref:Fibronectin type III domain-containing protein n=1 Tax=Sphingobacterium bambusae TaxID=662858 RepID=A0ABW6BBT7_9SPHI|nr:fibronectin type III domain-containing protein [Sphingobacterium bambusae]WPL46892.1 fibronectin type III domain-containing protein [Sphingobacterium bambusae]